MEKKWLCSYPKQVPAEISPDVYSSLVDLFLQSCHKFKHKPAYTNLGCSISYERLEKLTAYFASFLQYLKLKKGDRIAIILPNVLQFPVALFGALRAGLIVVNVNPLYTKREMVEQLNDAGVVIAITLENFATVLQKVVLETSLKHVIVTKIGDLLNFPKSCLANFYVKYIKHLVPKWKIEKVWMFKDVLHIGKNHVVTPVSIQREDIAFLQYTGGTTGVSKGAVLTHRNILANIEQVFAWAAPSVNVGEETIITAIPMYHIFSLLVNCLLFFKVGGMNVLITNPRDLDSFINVLSKYPFTVMVGVNTLYNALLNKPQFARINFSSLKISIGGGMSLQKNIIEKWMKVTGKPLHEGYGLTEASPVVSILPLTEEPFIGSIGLPLPSTQVKLIDKKGATITNGAAGELCVKGPQVMQGYWNNDAETAAVLKDGWLLTGDIATIDERGFIKLLERKKDIIVVSGFNVYPKEVEAVIMTCPHVSEVAVVGVRNEYSGEVVKAFIVRSDASLTEIEVIKFCKEKLTAYKIPKLIEFRDDLPKSNVGKILRRKLREDTLTV